MKFNENLHKIQQKYKLFIQRKKEQTQTWKFQRFNRVDELNAANIHFHCIYLFIKRNCLKYKYSTEQKVIACKKLSLRIDSESTPANGACCIDEHFYDATVDKMSHQFCMSFIEVIHMKCALCICSRVCILHAMPYWIYLSVFPLKFTSIRKSYWQSNLSRRFSASNIIIMHIA